MRLNIDITSINENRKTLVGMKDMYGKLLKALEIMDSYRQASFITDEKDVDTQLYDGFFPETDKTAMAVVRAADKEEINSVDLIFKDDRLNKLFPLYKARNFPKHLSSEERFAWEKFRFVRLIGGGTKSLLSNYFMRLSEIAKRSDLTSNQQYLLEELQLYGESIMPEPEDDHDE
jgi:exodeoxyribonuclease-1